MLKKILMIIFIFILFNTFIKIVYSKSFSGFYYFEDDMFNTKKYVHINDLGNSNFYIELFSKNRFNFLKGIYKLTKKGFIKKTKIVTGFDFVIENKKLYYKRKGYPNIKYRIRKAKIKDVIGVIENVYEQQSSEISKLDNSLKAEIKRALRRKVTLSEIQCIENMVLINSAKIMHNLENPKNILKSNDYNFLEIVNKKIEPSKCKDGGSYSLYKDSVKCSVHGFCNIK